MTSLVLTLDGVSYRLPDGRLLFEDLTAQFDYTPTALIGRNGVGKSVLARLLAGQLEPSAGDCRRPASVHYLAQQVALPAAATVATLAGIAPVWRALRRIEAGSTATEDFEQLQDRCDIRQQWQRVLRDAGLASITLDTPARELSGGQVMRIALLGALYSKADFLILDEPSNHLDRPGRQQLLTWLAGWAKGLLVISHDRALLQQMERIVELSPRGLSGYGGNYAHYLATSEVQQHASQNTLDQLRNQRRQQQRQQQQQHERAQQRQSRGQQAGRDANQAAILLGRQRQRAEQSSSRLHAEQQAARDQLAEQIRNAATQVTAADTVTLFAPCSAVAAGTRVARLQSVGLPHLQPPWDRLDLHLRGPQRIGLIGPNGCGKSTLLRVLAGEWPGRGGACQIPLQTAYFDQQLQALHPAQGVLTQWLARHPDTDQARLRHELSQLGLDSAAISRPSGQLSGGERLKAALALALAGDTPAQLLLLDEPDNHLDLPSRQALEQMLNAYRGALLIASHDDNLLDQLKLTHALLATDQGWQLRPWVSGQRY